MSSPRPRSRKLVVAYGDGGVILESPAGFTVTIGPDYALDIAMQLAVAAEKYFTHMELMAAVDAASDTPDQPDQDAQ